MDAELFGGAAFGQHDAVALFLVPADDGGHRSQVECLAFAQELERRPRQKRRVDVHVKEHFAHGTHPLLCIIP